MPGRQYGEQRWWPKGEKSACRCSGGERVSAKRLLQTETVSGKAGLRKLPRLLSEETGCTTSKEMSARLISGGEKRRGAVDRANPPLSRGAKKRAKKGGRRPRVTARRACQSFRNLEELPIKASSNKVGSLHRHAGQRRTAGGDHQQQRTITLTSRSKTDQSEKGGTEAASKRRWRLLKPSSA